MEEVQPCFLSVKHWKPQADLPTGHTRRLGVNSALSPEKGCAQHYRVGGSLGRGRGEASCGWWVITTGGGAQGARPGAMEAPKVIWLGPENFLSRTKVGAILEGADVMKWKCCFKNIEFPLSTFRSMIHTII